MANLTTLANVKEWLPIPTSTTSSDALLTLLITQVSDDFMRATLRPDLLQADYTEVQEYDGGRRFTTYHWPINEITSLSIGGITVTASPDKVQSGYYVDEDIDPERIYEVYLIGQTLPDGGAIEISYSAGYTTTPPDIESAVIEWIAYRYRGIPNTGLSRRRSTEGENIDVIEVDAPPTTKAVIERYRRKLPCVNRRDDEIEQKAASRVPKPGGRS
jgi:hypothetical protein